LKKLILLVIFITFCIGANSATEKVTLAAVGDVLLTRGCGKQIAKHGVNWLFNNTRDILKSTDLAFCNLECPLSTRGIPQKRRFLFRANPQLASSLHTNGFDVVSLANNHTLDYGRDAMLDTVNAVRESGMTPVGAGKNRADASRVKIVKRNGLRVGFVAYSDLPNYSVVPLPDKPTIAGLDTDSLPKEIKAAKMKCDALVVSIHWGSEYMKIPTERQKTIAHLCIDNGADLILGHHPHVLQPVEVYKGKPIVYSMGGFIWDYSALGADKSAIYIIELGKSSARLRKAIPAKIVGCQPRLKTLKVGQSSKI
jgi:poly-gamma-glutamate synthesis protein (capsule biosynthesis protein)